MNEYKNMVVYTRKHRIDDVFLPTLCRVSRRNAAPRASTHRFTVSLFVLIILIAAGSFLGRIGSTVSYFSDTERSTLNSMIAGLLAFTVSPPNVTDVYVGSEDGGGAAFIPVMSPDSGSFNIQYRVSAENFSGDSAFCDALVASATTSPFIYNGPLTSLTTAATTTIGAWFLSLSLPQNTSGVSEGNTCNADLVYRGWRDGAAEGQGYTDLQKVHLALRARMIVINEILPNPNGIAYGFDFGNDGDSMPKGEWVELYNNADTSFDLNGYYIWNSSGNPADKVLITNANTNISTTVITAHAWLVVYMNKEILDNTADEVRLYNPSDVLVDNFPYSGHDACALQPTPGTTNATTPTGGSCVTVPPNKSYARIPDGLGTRLDPFPTPGFANTLDVNTAIAELEKSTASSTENLSGGTGGTGSILDNLATDSNTNSTTTEATTTPSDMGNVSTTTTDIENVSTTTAETTSDVSTPSASSTPDGSSPVLISPPPINDSGNADQTPPPEISAPDVPPADIPPVTNNDNGAVNPVPDPVTE